MQAFDQIQELWQKHEVDIKVSADEMLQQAKKEVNNLKFKSILNILGMVSAFLAIAAVWIFIKFESWSTHLGISIIICAIAEYTWLLYRDHRLLARKDFTVYPKEYLQTLKTYQLNRYKLYTKLYWVYAGAISLGFVFYFIEILPYFTPLQKVITIAFTAAWMIFCSTILRKKVIQREKERIALLIEKFERISEQISQPQ
ncbi:hypothetical protein [Pedobacter sp. MW01-1-1]|uniref:hypothetical protein n=1 Tax=Pedobacter sp. MW01-1-1 TaxID=3383027 RepID=UPI003FF08363